MSIEESLDDIRKAVEFSAERDNYIIAVLEDIKELIQKNGAAVLETDRVKELEQAMK